MVMMLPVKFVAFSGSVLSISLVCCKLTFVTEIERQLQGKALLLRGIEVKKTEDGPALSLGLKSPHPR